MGRAIVATALGLSLAACGDDGSSGGSTSTADTDATGSSTAAGTSTGEPTTTTDGSSGSSGASEESSSGPSGSGSGSGSGSSSGGAGDLTCEGLPAFIAAFKESHAGNGGQDWDILDMTPAEIAADPDAQALLSLCDEDQRPVIPEIAWERGGNDHQWIAPEESPLYICVYIPVNPGTKHWSYDAKIDEVTADVFVGCPEQNPCNDLEGADQVMGCLGDMSNIEIVVDTASLGDGIDVGYDLSEASTQVYLLLENGDRVHMYTGL